MKLINELIFFIFPLLFAGLIHHLLIIKYNLFSFLLKPIDNNFKFRGKPLLGKSKTYRGLIAVPILSGIGSYIISCMIQIPTSISSFWLGFLLGLGYAIAELPNSFIKRRLNIEAGEKAQNKFFYLFLIFDQIDSVLGAIFVMLILYKASLQLCLLIILIGGLLHLLIDIYLNKYSYKKFRKQSVTTKNPQ